MKLLRPATAIQSSVIDDLDKENGGQHPLTGEREIMHGNAACIQKESGASEVSIRKNKPAKSLGIVEFPRGILIVEDEGIVAADIERSLRALGYRVRGSVPSAEEALDKVAEVQPELVLMDIVLAGPMDGVAAADAIRERFNIPVIYLTSHTDLSTVQRAKQTEPYGYVVKPFDVRTLRVGIETALCRHEAETRLKEVQRQAEAERMRLEEQLRQSQKNETVGQFVNAIAHDFNNLLMPILGYTELMQESLNIADPLRTKLNMIQSCAQRAADLTRYLLSFSRKRMLEMTLTNLNEVLTKFRPIFQRLIPEDIKLEICLDPKTVQVKVDPMQIEQLVMNLAVNARDAMEGGGTLTIETSSIRLHTDPAPGTRGLRPGHYSVLKVRDTGTGMDQKTLARIFEPFFTTKPNGKGTGLGLATVRSIVKQHGGWIDVESHPGHGTVFTIYLPKAETISPTAEALLRDVHEAFGRHPR